MSKDMRDIIFIVPGQPTAASAGSLAARGRVRSAVRVGAERGGGGPSRVAATPGEDVVVLVVANGPTLVLHPEDARDLLRAQAVAPTRGATGNAAAGDEVVVPA